MTDPAPDQAEPGPRVLSDSALLATYLDQRDVPCPACGYNLRKLQQPYCPECGNHLALAIGVVGGLSNAWITALISALAPAAIGLPFNLAILIALLYGEDVTEIAEEPEGAIFLLLAFYTAVCIPITVLLIAKRKRFLAARRDLQKSIATTLTVVASLAAFIAIVLLASALA